MSENLSKAGELDAILPRVYLLDVEGTTSPISLVNEQLFPYARKNLESFLRSHFLGVATQADLALLSEENQAETGLAAPRMNNSAGRSTDLADIDQALAYSVWLMDQDRKSTALKSLQGRIWKSGFDAGELVGTMFPDVAEALFRWRKHARVAIYSSGSVEAQQQLFSHSSAGDLTPYIAAYFDTRVGQKAKSGSYLEIAAELEVLAGEIVFVSDAIRELDAARAAGCETRLSLREGNQPVADENGHVAIRSFAELG